MEYVWADFRLDRRGTWLSRAGAYVVVSRRVLTCIAHLVEQRHRVVGHDELFRLLWGHDAVTHHQLTQIVVAARKVVEDDGQAQRLIRTYPGLGYRWVGEVSEVEGSDAVGPRAQDDAQLPVPDMTETDAQARESASTPLPRVPDLAPDPVQARAPARPRRAWRLRGSLLRTAGLLSLVLLLPVALLLHDRQRQRDAGDDASAPRLTSDTPAEFEAIRVALWRGEYQQAAERIAALPPDLARMREAKLLAVHLDIQQGRFEAASRRLTALHTDVAADVQGRARLLSTGALLNVAMGKSSAEVLVPAKSAVMLLESSDTQVAPGLMGEALLARGYGHMKALDYDQAMRDLLRSRDLLTEAGNFHDAADAADALARIHMRSGRYHQAHELFKEVAEYSRESDFPINEIFARNAMSKIDMELLRWDDALASSERSMRLIEQVPQSERRARVLLLRARALIGVGRLREAQALIEELDAIGDTRYSTITAAAYWLAADRLERASAAALQAQAFEGFGVHDTLLLESEEGALLLWLIAAQRRAAQGEPVPRPTAGQRALLETPASTVGLIARGRWFWLQGQYAPAEVDLRQAFVDARQQGHLSDMLAATAPLVESLLERGDVAAAEYALQELWKHDPDTLKADYEANLLKLRVAIASASASASPDRSAIDAALRATSDRAGERVLPELGLDAGNAGDRAQPLRDRAAGTR